MRINSKIVATVVAAALAFGSMIAPAAAAQPKSIPSGGGVSSGAKILGGCVFGGAFGLIFAALAKGKAYNNKKIELTRDEAWTIAGTCGLGTGWVVSKWKRP